jgi:3-vinyl bacteriochlorophyllide hydratase
MGASSLMGEKDGFGPGQHRAAQTSAGSADDMSARDRAPPGLVDVIDDLIDDLIDYVAPSPWGAHTGSTLPHRIQHKSAVRQPLYSPQERMRRDRSPWTLVQGILAPLQFLAFAVSVALVARYLITGQGYQIATLSILIKTAALYGIMITGSIWEKEVFGKWLFAHAFFWEDVFSMLVLGLQTAYVLALIFGWGTPREQMLISLAAYAAYAINASQFLWKLRQARLEAPANSSGASERMGHPA